MNILTEILKDKLEVDGIAYKVNPSFSIYIKINVLLQNKIQQIDNDNVSDISKQLLAYMKEFCPTFKFDLEVNYGSNTVVDHFFSKMMEFYNCSGEELNPTYGEEYTGRVIDFEMDKNTIFADFYREYNINLVREDIHVHEFLALLSGLSNKSGLKQRIHYRCAKTGKMKGEEKRKYEELKRLYDIESKGKMDEAEAWLKAEDERIKALKNGE